MKNLMTYVATLFLASLSFCLNKKLVLRKCMGFVVNSFFFAKLRKILAFFCRNFNFLKILCLFNVPAFFLSLFSFYLTFYGLRKIQVDFWPICFELFRFLKD